MSKNPLRGNDPSVDPFVGVPPEKEELWNVRHPSRLEPRLPVSSVIGSAHNWTGKQIIGTLSPATNIASPETGVFALSVNWDILGGGINQYGIVEQVYAQDTVASDVATGWHLVAIQASAKAMVTGDYHAVRAIHALAGGQATGTVNDIYGIEALGGVMSGVVTWAFGGHADTFVSGGTITNVIGWGAFCEPNHPGLIAKATNQYGFKCGSITGGVLNYAWYSESGKMRVGDTLEVTDGTRIVAVDGAGQYIGTNTAHNLRLRSNSTNRFELASATGHFYPLVDATYDFGIASTNRVRDIYASRDVIIGQHFKAGTVNWLLQTHATATNSSDLQLGHTGAPAASNVQFTFSIRSTDDTMWLFGYDGTTFKNIMGWDYTNNRVNIGVSSTSIALKFEAATSKIIGGATSLSIRSNADSADNILITDAGEITFRNQLKFITGSATSLGTHDANGLSFKTNTSIRWSIDTSGNLIGDTTNGGYLKFGPAVSKIIPGSTSISLRNNADAADNLIITDGGEVTLRNQLKFITGSATSIGTHDANGISIKTNANIRWSVDTSGNLLADTTNGGYIQFRPGSQTTNTIKVPGILAAWNRISTSSTVEVSIGSYVLKGNTITADGQFLRLIIRALESTQAGVFKVAFGATNVVNYSPPANTEFTIIVDIWRYNGATNQKARATRVITGGTTSESGTTPAEDTSGDITIDLRASVTAGGTLEVLGATLEYLAA